MERNLHVKVTLLSDLHIGSGKGLINGLDWLRRDDGDVYFADNSTLLERILERAIADGKNELTVINAITGLKLGDLIDAGWLARADFEDRGLFPMRLRGEPATIEIRQQIKNVQGQPYLPGSSLKGALRTVLATAAAADLKPNVQAEELGERRSWAAQPVERTLFGRDPNHDFLRLLQVSDSTPLPVSTLRLRRAHIYPTATSTTRGRSKGLDLDLETVTKGTEFQLNLHLPLELLEPGQGKFEERRKLELGDWERRKRWLERLNAHGREYARKLLIDEVTYFQQRDDVPIVHRFYDDLATRFSKLAKNQFMLALGWGTGWHTKTLNQYLKQDNKNFEAIARQYRLDPTGDRKPGDRFPKSRHLLRQPNGEPGEPLGWVLIEVNLLSL